MTIISDKVRDPSGIQLSACFARPPSVVRDPTTEVCAPLFFPFFSLYYYYYYYYYYNKMTIIPDKV